MPRLTDLTGKRFGRLLVLRRAPNRVTPNGVPRTKWVCYCDCGHETTADAQAMKDGRSQSCGCLQKEKMSKRNFRHGLGHTSEGSMFTGARLRAASRGLPFNLTRDDIQIPEFCPLLGLRLVPRMNRYDKRGLQPDSPSIDRIRPELGYVKGNVWVISHKANTIKSDASLDDLRKIVAGLEARL